MKMIQHCIDTIRERSKNRIGRLEKQLNSIRQLNVETEREAVYLQLAGAMRHAELLARESRAAVIELHSGLEALGLVPSEKPLPGLPDVQIREESGVFIIRMDALLPFSGRGNVYYLHEALNRALDYWREDNCLPAPLIENRAVVLFRHHYDRERTRHIRDYDNMEYKCVINTLARHFLWDDNPAGYMLVQTAVLDDAGYTEVLIMGLPDFQRFMAGGKL